MLTRSPGCSVMPCTDSTCVVPSSMRSVTVCGVDELAPAAAETLPPATDCTVPSPARTASGALGCGALDCGALDCAALDCAAGSLSTRPSGVTCTRSPA